MRAKRIWVRRVQTTTDHYELVETGSSDAIYVERDSAGEEKIRVEADKTTEFVVEEWRLATPLEAALMRR